MGENDIEMVNGVIISFPGSVMFGGLRDQKSPGQTDDVKLQGDESSEGRNTVFEATTLDASET